ncbi:MAG: GGDEF domain-containing protein [Candidatus Krumholzibacteria bacterium]|nr:GGDEF domain-containing protein [Candidatus Krumholzibacteria bacterium]
MDHTVRIKAQKRSQALRRIYAVLIVIQGREIGRDYRLRKPEYVIGRDRDCDICIPEKTVSRTHAKIQVTYCRQRDICEYRLVDMGSTNKTFVDNSEVQSVPLKNGQKIRIGNTILKFELIDAEDIKYHREIQRKIKYDDLTGLLTKESLYLALQHELMRCKQFNLPLSVLMMDLDYFKRVNDTYGHPAGSHTLKEIGSIISKNLRETDVSARYGGEEFVSYLSERAKDTAGVAADHLRTAIANTPIIFGDATISITISIGIAQFPEDGRTIDELVAKADEALYVAKNQGRNQVRLA